MAFSRFNHRDVRRAADFYEIRVFLVDLFFARLLQFALLVLAFFAIMVPGVEAAVSLEKVHPRVTLAEKISDWVEVPPQIDVVEPESENEKAAGYKSWQYQLLDLQHRVHEAGVDYHVQVKMDIFSHAGLQQSQLEIEFDPVSERIEWKRLGLSRNGRYIDLTSTALASVLDRERSLEAALLFGRKTLLIIVPDVRVGDTLEYAYELKERNPLWKNRFFLMRYLEQVDMAQRFFLRVAWPRHRPITWATSSQTPGIVLYETARNSHLTYDSAAIEMGPFQQNPDPQSEKVQSLPDNTGLVSSDRGAAADPAVPLLEFSEFESWHSLADWLNMLWTGLEDYGNEKEVLNVWREILAQERPDLFEQAEHSNSVSQSASASMSEAQTLVKQAVHWVQDEVRYFGLESGIGAIRPRSPMTVLTTRFGDCKDKALLLVSLLQGMGVNAAPVLVHTEQKKLPYQLPTPAAFNHVIVQIPWKGEVVWVDPTRAWQGGDLWQMNTAKFEKGLVLGKTHSAWAQRPLALHQNTTQVKTHFKVSGVEKSPSTLTVTTLYTGEAADQIRSQLKRLGNHWQLNARLKRLKGYYASLRIGQPLVIDDQRRQNRLTIQERYFLEQKWRESQSNQSSSRFYADSLFPLIKAMEAQIEAGAGLVEPQTLSHQISIELPEPGWQVPQVQEYVTNNHFSFSFSSQMLHTNKVVLGYKMQPLAHPYARQQASQSTDQVFADLERVKSVLVVALKREPHQQVDSLPGLWASSAVLITVLLGFLVKALNGTRQYGRWMDDGRVCKRSLSNIT